MTGIIKNEKGAYKKLNGACVYVRLNYGTIQFKDPFSGAWVDTQRKRILIKRPTQKAYGHKRVYGHEKAEELIYGWKSGDYAKYKEHLEIYKMKSTQ